MDKGDKVVRYGGKTNGRYQIKYPTSKGYRLAWCDASDFDTYCAAVSASSPRATSSKTTKTLNVNLQRQTDYPKDKIGTRTIKDVGCLVTSMAMFMTYKTGKSYTPTTIVKKFTFSNNDLEWSSVPYSFTKSTSLKDVYQSINKGNPVLVTGKKSGSTDNWHWVLIYGYKNADVNNLSASNFVIRDPMGRDSTLQEFMKRFPENVSYRICK